MINSWLDGIQGIIFKLGALPWQMSRKAPVPCIWMFVHCSGEEVSVYSANLLRIVSVAANSLEHPLPFFCSCQFHFLFGFLVKLRQILSLVRDIQYFFGDLYGHFSLHKFCSASPQSLHVWGNCFSLKVLACYSAWTQAQMRSVMMLMTMRVWVRMVMMTVIPCTKHWTCQLPCM